ncbi:MULTISPECIES: DUF1189 family protein [unclassified Streptococcus]|uniref:DUF1189 family protein n=1 Tax=unclassified Streptococcus TaxID=2608887 RepID=UPI001F0E0EDC|nr:MULTISPECIES: DUF1189 family protein [unclassified Streptococcus]
MILPSAFQIARLGTYPLDTILEGVYSPLTNDVMNDLKTAVITDNTLTYTGPNHDQVYFGDDTQDVTGFSYQLTAQQVIIRKNMQTVAEISYQHLKTKDFQNRDSLTQALSRAWFQENRLTTSLLLMSVSGLILAANFIILLLDASGILYLTKKSNFFDFQTFKECVNFSLNCLGLPTILAALIGLLGQPIPSVITIQNMLFVLIMIWVFFKTKFRDPEIQ